MKTIKISATFAASVTAAGSAPWLIICEDYAVNVYPSRAAARAAKTANKFTGSIVKASEIELVVVDAPKLKAEISRKSQIESPCWIVWDLCEKMTGARRKDVIAAAIEKGVAFYTARTQYQHWYTAEKGSKKAAK